MRPVGASLSVFLQWYSCNLSLRRARQTVRPSRFGWLSFLRWEVSREGRCKDRLGCAEIPLAPPRRAPGAHEGEEARLRQEARRWLEAFAAYYLVTVPEKVSSMTGWRSLPVASLTLRRMGPVASGPCAFGSKIMRRVPVSPGWIVSRTLELPPCPGMPLGPTMEPFARIRETVVHMHDVTIEVIVTGSLEAFWYAISRVAVTRDMGISPQFHEVSESVSAPCCVEASILGSGETEGVAPPLERPSQAKSITPPTAMRAGIRERL